MCILGLLYIEYRCMYVYIYLNINHSHEPKPTKINHPTALNTFYIQLYNIFLCIHTTYLNQKISTKN